MVMIDKLNECLGKYSTKKKADELAIQETKRTGKKHNAFLSHYHDIKLGCDVMFWSIILTDRECDNIDKFLIYCCDACHDDFPCKLILKEGVDMPTSCVYSNSNDIPNCEWSIKEF